ncbi:TPA: division/cell wall cluster transcriptional repressor MraZ [Streptococcus suis]
MLIGEYQHNIDSKGRLTMPAKFRPDLGERFIITRGLDGCLFGYPMASWEETIAKLKQLSSTRNDVRKFTRLFFSAATEVEFDKQGRINLSKAHIESAKIDKECRVIGVSDHIEIWSSDQWDAYASSASDHFDEIAESLFDFGL